MACMSRSRCYSDFLSILRGKTSGLPWPGGHREGDIGSLSTSESAVWMLRDRPAEAPEVSFGSIPMQIFRIIHPLSNCPVGYGGCTRLTAAADIYNAVLALVLQDMDARVHWSLGLPFQGFLPHSSRRALLSRLSCFAILLVRLVWFWHDLQRVSQLRSLR